MRLRCRFRKLRCGKNQTFDETAATQSTAEGVLDKYE